MSWKIKYLPEAITDINKLEGSQKKQVLKAINKVSQNPLPASEGGLGKPLGNKKGNNLTSLLKIKLLKIGIRIVYDLICDEHGMRIIVVGVRADNEVYDIAKKRLEKGEHCK